MDICMSKERASNFDLLRIVCAIGVVLLHVSTIFMNDITNEITTNGFLGSNLWVVSLYYVMPRFAVPCFVMLSGAFILEDDRNANFKWFYKKVWRKIGIPTILFSAGYTVFSVIKEVVIANGNITASMFIEPVKYWLIGYPYYHMWYLYMLFGLYFMTPIIILVKQNISIKTFEKAAWILLLLGCISGMINTYCYFWDLSYSFCYLGYFMLGYLLKNKYSNQKNQFYGVIMILISFFIEFVMTFLFYEKAKIGETATFFGYSIIEPLSPLAAMTAISMFIGFTKLTIKQNLKELSEDTFYVYLIHAIFVTFYHAIMVHFFELKADARILIPVGVIGIYAVSEGLSRMIKCITSIMSKGFNTKYENN